MSTLLEIRTQFAKLSGRYDLVTGAFADAGADYYLKAGIKFLDRRVEFQKDVAKFFKTCAIGTFFVEFSSWRTTDRVWFANAVDGRWELEYMTPGDFQLEFGTEPYTDVDDGTPSYFTYAITRSVPEGTALSVIGNYGSEILVDGTQTGKQGLLIMNPTDTAGMIEVWGKYETPWPSADNKDNYWFNAFPHIAVNAALYQLEVSYRNTEGQKDWLNAIDMELKGIDMDTVENDSNRAEEMEG